MAHQHPVIRRDETILSVLLGLFVLALAIAIVLSPRSLFYGSRSLVIAGAPLPPGHLPADFIRVVDDYGVHIPKFERRPLLSIGAPAPVDTNVDSRAQATPLRFGYSVHEFAAAGLPFRLWPEFGHVLYYETPRQYVVAPVTDDYLRQVKVPMARPLDAGDYNLWRFHWGWLFVAAGLGIALFELGAVRRRRAALDLI